MCERALGAVINTEMIAFVYLLCISIVIVKLSNEVTFYTYTGYVCVCFYYYVFQVEVDTQREKKQQHQVGQIQ